jgi:hypothetical protein
VDHELHPTGLVEEPLGDDGPLAWQAPQETPGFREILDELLGGHAS